MASSLAVEDSADLDLNAGKQEGAVCGVKAESPSAPDLDRAAEVAVDASSEVGVSEESNMEVIDSGGEPRAGAAAVERCGVTSTIEEVELGVGNGSSEKVDDDNHEKVPHKVDQPDSAGKDINIQEEECSPPVHEAVRSSVVEAETVSVSGVDEPVPGVAGSCYSDSAQQNVGNTPCDIQGAQAVVEEEYKAVIVDEPSVGGDQVGIKDVPSSSSRDNIAESIGLQQEKEKYSTDRSADVGRCKGECLADADVGTDTTVIVKCGEAIKKDGEPEPYVSQVQTHPNTIMEIQVTHMADVECQTGHAKLEGDSALVQMQAKIVVDDISFTEGNTCMDNRITGHNPNNHLDVTDQAQGSNIIATVCPMMTEESDTSVNLVGIETERLNMAGDVEKAHVKVGAIGNEIELTMNAQSLTEENYSSGNEAMNHDAVEHFQGAAGICLSEDNNPNEGLVVDSTNGMDVNQEVLLLQMNQKETLALAGQTEGGEQSVLVVGSNQNDLEVDNSIDRNERNTHKDPDGSGSNLLNTDPSAEAHLSKVSVFYDKNVSSGDSVGFPNTTSDVLITTRESRGPLLADKESIENQDVTVPPVWSNVESKSSDICSTDSNLMEKEYFVMEGLNLSVEISVPTASELSEIQAVMSEDIESADHINSLEDKLKNPGGIDMDDEHGRYTGSEKQTMMQCVEYKENDQHACYYILPEEKHSFSISDLVWGKVKSHPWWPGQIFDPSYASELALKHQKKDSFLVAYFGDKTFAWCDESQLKPFQPYFSQMEKQSSSDMFVNAIDDALEEVSRRTELGMTCFCYSSEATSSLACKKVENAGIREGSNSCVVGKAHIVSCFHPDRFVNYAKALAQTPFGEADRFELAVAKAHLKAFYRSRGYFEHPFLQNSGCNSESGTNIYQSAYGNVGEGSTEHMISTPIDSSFRKYKSRGKGGHSNKQMTDSEMEKTLLELTDTEVACELANGCQTEIGAEIGGEPVAVYTGKIRKAPDSDSSDSDTRKRKKLDSLGDMETKLPSPTFSSSFKVGECIRRVASQLAGSPSILRTNVEASHKNASKDDSVFDVFVAEASPNSVMHSTKMKMADPEDYSPDELLSQLCAAAVDPMMGHKSVGTQLTFFTDFRNYCVVSSTEQMLPEKGRRGRKRKVETRIASSMLITDHMQDTYWSDLASCQSPVNGPRNKETATGRSQRRKRKVTGQTSLSPSSVPLLENAECRQVGSPNMKSSLIVERSIIRVEEKIVDECIPTALILNFNGLKPLPSETELTRIFSRYGPLKEEATEVRKKNNFVKVVFKRRADAEIAFSNTGKYSIFGPSLLSYRLRYLPLTPDSSPDTELQENDAIPFDDVSFEILDTCETTYMSLDTKSEDKSDAVPIETSDLETLYNCSIAYTSSDSKSEDKSDPVPVEDTNFEISDSCQDGYASSDTKLQDKNVVPMEVSSLEIMDSCQAAYASPDTSSQEKGDAVPMADSNLETPAFSQGNASLDTELQEKDDPVPLEDRNLETPAFSQGDASLDTESQEKDDPVSLEDRNLEVPDGLAYASQDTKSQDKIMDSCQTAYASPDASTQDKGDAVPMEDELETLDFCQGNASLDTEMQDKDDPVPLEDGNLEIPDSCQAAYASQDTKSQSKSNVVPMEDSNSVTLDICQDNASTDIKSEDKNDQVPLEDGSIEIPESCQATSASQDTSSQDKNDATPLEDINLETPDPCQGNVYPDTKSEDENDPVPSEDSNLEISDSFRAASASQDAKSQDKNDAVLVEDTNLETPDTCQGNASPDTKPQDKNDTVPTEDCNPEIPDILQIANASPGSKLQDKNYAVPTEDDNLETSDACQDSEDKKDPVSHEDGSRAPEICQTALVSSDMKSAQDDAVTFEDSSLRASDDHQTACTPSEMRPHDKNDSVPTKDGNLETPGNRQIASSPDTKPGNKIDAVPIKCSSQGTPEDCQTPDTKSQEK